MAVEVTLPLTVRARRAIADRVTLFELARADGGVLPVWEPGAHVDVHLPSGLIRQYSLCGLPGADAYAIAVLREEGGRGGSRELCDLAAEGTVLSVAAPRNHFALRAAPAYLFIAGGIGITPILAMIRDAASRGVPWTLAYRGAARTAMGFLDELAMLPGGSVMLAPADETARPDLAGLLRAMPPGALAYCCGPNAMLDGATEAAAIAGCADRLVVERFGASGEAIDTSGDTGFEVELAQSGITIAVPADRRLGDVLAEHGVPVSFSCEDGYCGTCETRVLSGEPCHRDSVLSDEDKASGQFMMVCVSRAKSSRLVLDL